MNETSLGSLLRLNSVLPIVHALFLRRALFASTARISGTSPCVMRRPSDVERLYLDFDGFFASVEQAARPRLRGRPVGVVPFAGTDRTIIIACSREAKLAGVKNVMPVQEARHRCPDIVLIPQSPDLYRRAHNALISEIGAVLPVAAIKSIDELTCDIEPAHRSDPQALGGRIKTRLRDHIGPYITCSIGIAANRQLAKMACKAGKWHSGQYGDGLMVWHPSVMPDPLLKLPLDEVPGIGPRMAGRLVQAGIVDMAALLATAPKQMRGLWRNVNGERLWYAPHGYDVRPPSSGRGMYGHGRVLPPEHRSVDAARSASRLLATKTARRMRRDGWCAGRLTLWLSIREGAGAVRPGCRRCVMTRRCSALLMGYGGRRAARSSPVSGSCKCT